MVPITLAVAGFSIDGARANPVRFELKSDAPAPGPQTLISGPIKAIVTQTKVGDQTLPLYLLSYDVFYKNELKLSVQAETMMTGSLELKDLDNNQIPEVIASSFSGGAHCCVNYSVYGWQSDQSDRFVSAKLGPLDGGGGQFKDLDGDGTQEFVSVDNAFFYAFAPYAGSFPPTRIQQYRAGRFVPVTRQYPKVLKAHAWEMFKTLQQYKQDDISLNGVLAGYVAQKILLGEYEEGWKLMLARYDRQSDWGLDIYQGDKVVGRHPDFPSALKAFLVETGYLSRNGQPIRKDQ